MPGQINDGHNPRGGLEGFRVIEGQRGEDDSLVLVDTHAGRSAETVDCRHSSAKQSGQTRGACGEVVSSGAWAQVDVGEGLKGADKRVIDKHEQDGRERATLFDAAADGDAGAWIECGAGDRAAKKTADRADKPGGKPLRRESFENEIMMNRIKSFSVIG